MSDDARLAQLEEEHVVLVLRRFDRADAWELGRSIAERALAAKHPVAIDVRTAAGMLFHASLPGATADNDVWAAKKAATALRFETSTALLEARIAHGGRDMYEPGWLDPVTYAVAGGSVPIRVDGVGVVAVATMSGLASADDHDAVADGIRALQQRAR
ncbi:heme-binding protein [Microbacterium sp. 3J1]|uniref:heme-binding protein n=1 Tax=Microbacterium sp. 3J1 TaxID=861269 RepID=UPI000A40B0DA|nr:heme-binding protein [Microbacterium sp. 3J1]